MITEIETDDGENFRLRGTKRFQPGQEVDLFLRPESMLIEPDERIENLNRFRVEVKAILFDGANSRLLVHPLGKETELLIALPQNRQYDYVQVGDRIEIGWHERAGICFPRENASP